MSEKNDLISFKHIYDLSYRRNLQKFFVENHSEHVDCLRQWAEEIKNICFFSQDTNDINVLEVGCGIGRLTPFLAQIFGQTIGVDFSPYAISQAQKLNVNSQGIFFINQDFLKFSYPSKFSLIFDSHCFHCIPWNEDRITFLKKSWENLKIGGFLAMETMVYNNALSEILDEDGLYWEKVLTSLDPIVENWLPTRRVKRAYEIENEILNMGFKIVYFKVQDQLKIVLPDGKSMVDLLRVIACKKSNIKIN